MKTEIVIQSNESRGGWPGEGVDLKYFKKLCVYFQVSFFHFLILSLPSVLHTFLIWLKPFKCFCAHQTPYLEHGQNMT